MLLVLIYFQGSDVPHCLYSTYVQPSRASELHAGVILEKKGCVFSQVLDFQSSEIKSLVGKRRRNDPSDRAE